MDRQFRWAEDTIGAVTNPDRCDKLAAERRSENPEPRKRYLPSLGLTW